jgi:hypothetical protein
MPCHYFAKMDQMNATAPQADESLRDRILNAIEVERTHTTTLLSSLLTLAPVSKDTLSSQSQYLLELSISSCFRQLIRLDTRRKQLTPERRSLIYEHADQLMEEMERESGAIEEEEMNAEEREIEEIIFLAAQAL